jgi:hypothetical protein
MHTPTQQQIDTALVSVAACLINLNYPRQHESLSIKDMAHVYGTMRPILDLTHPIVSPVFSTQLLLLLELGFGDVMITPAHYEQAKKCLAKVTSPNPTSN